MVFLSKDHQILKDIVDAVDDQSAALESKSSSLAKHLMQTKAAGAMVTVSRLWNESMSKSLATLYDGSAQDEVLRTPWMLALSKNVRRKGCFTLMLQTSHLFCCSRSATAFRLRPQFVQYDLKCSGPQCIAVELPKSPTC